MMTLQEMLEIVDELSWDELNSLQERINQRRQTRRVERDFGAKTLTNEEVMRQIQEILKDAEPVEIIRGTMDVDKLMEGIDAMREGFTQEELDELAAAMTEEYIEMDEPTDG